MKYNFKRRNLKKNFLAEVTVLSLGLQLMPFSSVSASNDKVKPVIKLSGKQNITVEQGKKVKIPKVTAKDNVDGNLTKKITLKISAPGLKSKEKKSIIKNVKKNKKITFTKEGKYVITYTVKDTAGNKSSKKRYITVVSPKKEEKTTEIINTTENQVTEATTEVVKDNNEKTIEKPVEVKKEENTENQSTEQTTESNTESQDSEEDVEIIDGFVVINDKTVSFKDGVIDYSDFNPKEVTVDGKTYTVISDPDFKEFIRISKMYKENMELNVGARINTFFINYDSPMSENCSYLKFFGNISANDKNGNDISQNIAIYEPEVFESNDRESNALFDSCYIYCLDENGDGYYYTYYLSFGLNQEYLASKYTKINDDPFVYVSYKEKIAEKKNSNQKVLVMKKTDLYTEENKKNLL